MRKAIGYVRVSTDKQAKSGLSSEAQETAIRNYCIYRGLDLGEIIHDDGISGSTINKRPGVLKALAIAKQTKGVVVFYSLSRFTRDRKDLFIVSDELRAAGADFASTSEQIDTSTAGGNMLFGILAIINQWEKEVISERTSVAIMQKRLRGEVYGQIPYGYQRGKQTGSRMIGETEKKTYAIDENNYEQNIIRIVGDFRVEGLSFQKISDHLNMHEYLTRKAKTEREKGMRSDSRWTRARVHQVFKQTKQNEDLKQTIVRKMESETARQE